MPTFTEPVREQLNQARRNQILDGAAAMFARKGFHRTTTREIAKAAGVAEGTIYNYFASKNDLLLGLILRLAELDELSEDLTQGLESNAREFFSEIFRQRMCRIEQSHELLQALLPEILTNPQLRDQFRDRFVAPIADLLETYVQAHVEQGQMRPVNTALVVRAVQSMFLGLLVLRLLGDERLSTNWNQLPEVIAALLFDGLGPR